MDKSAWCKRAIGMMNKAYAPYSQCFVGAALLTANGKVYEGCNVENASFSATVCAERTALFKAISDGERAFTMIAVAGGKNGKIEGFSPCGICRQVLSEFCDPDFIVLIVTGESTFEEYRLSELLPFGFSADKVRG